MGEINALFLRLRCWLLGAKTHNLQLWHDKYHLCIFFIHQTGSSILLYAIIFITSPFKHTFCLLVLSTTAGCDLQSLTSTIATRLQLSDAETCTRVSLWHTSEAQGEHRGAVVPPRGCSAAVCMCNKPKHNDGFYRDRSSFWSGDAVPHLIHFI